jgi:2'-5' RNA ligase superfamily
MSHDTFVLTLRMDAASADRLNVLRERYFPPERNVLRAHFTLFHTLNQQQCAQLLAERAIQDWSALQLEFLSPMSIGRGVAIKVGSEETTARHGRLIQMLGVDGLTRQDRQSLRPHVTVQNKVTPAVAAATLTEIQKSFVPWSGQGIGLDFWRYLGGPWAPYQHVLFS